MAVLGVLVISLVNRLWIYCTVLVLGARWLVIVQSVVLVPTVNFVQLALRCPNAGKFMTTTIVVYFRKRNFS